MLIKPATAIQEDYEAISNLCKETREPVFLTVAGEGDLVVEDLRTWNRRQKEMEIARVLRQSEEDYLAGVKGITIDEWKERITQQLTEAHNG